jgi:hypothetical protein
MYVSPLPIFTSFQLEPRGPNEGIAPLNVAPFSTIFSPERFRGPQPKWVTTTNTHPYLPSHVTPIPDLFLAAARTKTQAGV